MGFGSLELGFVDVDRVDGSIFLTISGCYGLFTICYFSVYISVYSRFEWKKSVNELDTNVLTYYFIRLYRYRYL